MHPVGFEPTLSFENRIMSAMQSTTLPWMLLSYYGKISNIMKFYIMKFFYFVVENLRNYVMVWYSWVRRDLNPRHPASETCALIHWATNPYFFPYPFFFLFIGLLGVYLFTFSDTSSVRRTFTSIRCIRYNSRFVINRNWWSNRTWGPPWRFIPIRYNRLEKNCISFDAIKITVITVRGFHILVPL